VGCGCGAITRFLGEKFDDVVSVEGTLARAKLARLRTKNMSNVNIINAPFQDIDFVVKFDIIICIGVFEYSSSFISGNDPHDEVLRYFKNMLSPDGVVFIAIENQFGLKYFSSSKEDHTNVMFDGIEGYPRFNDSAKTFGYIEIKSRLKKHFKEIKFYFPYPDYKLPLCILSEDIFEDISVGELIGGYQFGRDNDYFTAPLFDEQLTLLELEKNEKLEFFANSFLILASNTDIKSVEFPQLGIFFSVDRKKPWQTVSRIERDDDGVISVNKSLLSKERKVTVSDISLQETSSIWIDGFSLETTLLRMVRFKNMSINELFKPCIIWVNTLRKVSEIKDGECTLDGKYLDYIWRNSYLSNNEGVFIDQEWVRESEILLNVLVIRAIFHFLVEIENTKDISPQLKQNSTKKLIERIAKVLDVSLSENDFTKFVTLEAEFAQIVHGKQLSNSELFLKVYLYNRGVVRGLSYTKRIISLNIGFARRVLRYFYLVPMKLFSILKVIDWRVITTQPLNRK
jgi:SAM-dependent methyltransferase